MGGKIEIIDKDIGKRGTCFKFNTYLTPCEDQKASNTRDQWEDIESNVSFYNSSGES